MLERLQKIIARAGIASRRHAEQLIVSGQVRVNGQVVTQLGSKADPARDRIEAGGRLVRLSESQTYLILHKPTQVVSTMSDPEGRKTLRHFLRGVPGRVFPVGRLDYSVSGLVLLTSDGELANRILKVAARLPQIYWIKMKGRLGAEERNRVERETHARVRALKSSRAAGPHPANPWYEVTLRDARRDALRQSLLELGHPVEKMKRVRLANLELDALPEGRYRYLDEDEVSRLVQSVNRAGKMTRAGGE
jgi:pseudouridine synthase